MHEALADSKAEADRLRTALGSSREAAARSEEAAARARTEAARAGAALAEREKDLALVTEGMQVGAGLGSCVGLGVGVGGVVVMRCKAAARAVRAVRQVVCGMRESLRPDGRYGTHMCGILQASASVAPAALPLRLMPPPDP